jgi:hemolysin III
MKVINLSDFENEEFWNTITHFIGFILCLIGIPLLFYFNQNLTSLSFVACSLFSLGLLMVYGSSSAYHFVTDKQLKKKLRILDHISIYYLILGSYAPMCLIALYDSSGLTIFLTVLILAVVGTIKKLFFTGKYGFISLLLYLLMGWMVVFYIRSFIELIDFGALVLIALGGLSYTLGVVFYARDNKKYFHAIWHMFVLGGSIFHYLAVLLYII